MQLKRYPGAINDIACQLADLEYAIATLKLESEAIETVVDSTVAFSEILKNDGQRKAKKAEMLQENQTYQDLVRKLTLNQLTKTKLTAQLECLRGEFSVLKLQRRGRLASVFTGMELADLIA